VACFRVIKALLLLLVLVKTTMKFQSWQRAFVRV